MKRTLLSLLLFLFCSVAFGQNDFSGDATCVALYNVESGNIVVDSAGTNTLTNSGGNITSDTTNFKQGSGSALSTSADYELFINDVDVDAGFPGEGGTGNTSFSFCLWSRHTTLNADNYLISKYNAGTGARSYFIDVEDNAGDKQVRLVIGYNGGASAIVAGQHTGTNFVVNQWYHTGVTYDGSTKDWRIRVWDDNGSSVSETTDTAAETMSPDTAAFTIFDAPSGVTGTLGQIDEVVVFNRAITADEIDQIRQGIFGASAGQFIMISKDFWTNFLGWT